MSEDILNYSQMLQERKRHQNWGINHLPNSAGNVTPDHLEALGCFQEGKTGSFYLRFQPQFELTALHSKNKAFNHPSNHNCCGCVCILLLFCLFHQFSECYQICLCFTRAFWQGEPLTCLQRSGQCIIPCVFVTAKRNGWWVPHWVIRLSAKCSHRTLS